MNKFNTIAELHVHACIYRSVPGKRPLPGKRPCTACQGAIVAAYIHTYGILILGKRPCGPKSQVMFKRPWVLTWDTTGIIIISAESIANNAHTQYQMAGDL